MKLGQQASDFEQTFETSWDRCLRILNHYKDNIQAAPRAIHILETLRRQIETAQAQSLLSLSRFDLNV